MAKETTNIYQSYLKLVSVLRKPMPKPKPKSRSKSKKAPETNKEPSRTVQFVSLPTDSKSEKKKKDSLNDKLGYGLQRVPTPFPMMGQR